MPTIDATHTTLLRIDDITLSPYATRQIQVSVEPIAQASQVARDVNGTLFDLSLDQFRKYSVTISGADQESPILTSVWPGKAVSVSLIPNVGINEDSTGDTSGEITLNMLVVSWSNDVDEQEAEASWEISFEEI